MKTIVMCVGLPASGKSTWCLNEMLKKPNKYKRVNKDLLRKTIDAGAFSVSNEKFINNIKDNIVETALVRGFDVLEDNTNFSDKQWYAMCEIAKRVGDVRVFEKYFEVSLKDAIARNISRPEPVPEDVIVNMYEKYIKNKRLEVRDEYFPKVDRSFHKDPNKKNAIIVDLDGTIAINNHRDYYDYSSVDLDAVNDPIRDLVEILAPHYHVLFVSGRDDSCMDLTKKWIKKSAMLEIPYDIFMRKTGDSRKDAIVKKEIYDTHIDPFYNICYAIDDRPSVIHLWQSLNLPILQVNNLDF